MKMLSYIISLSLLLMTSCQNNDLGANPNFANELENHSDEHKSSNKKDNFHPKKAVLLVDEEEGLKLSDEAIKTIGIKFITPTTNRFTILKSALVSSMRTTGVYRFREGSFKLIPVTVVKDSDEKYLVSTAEFTTGDKVVVGGASLLRVADIYSTDKSEHSHAH